MSLLLLLNATTNTGPAGVYTHSFPGIRPSARYDGNGWITVTVAESSTRTGTYTDLVTATLDPADADPTEPTTRDITVTGATLAAGWYRFTFTDAAGELEVYDPVYSGPSGIRPTVQDVARRMPDRTTVDGGGEARTFTDETTPTAEEVQQAIDDALDIVEPRVPAGAGPEIVRAARQAVTLEACLAVESGNWGEQIEPNEARVSLWERLLASYYTTIDAAANDDLAGSARFGSIPVVSPTLTAWSTMTGIQPSTELIP